jgi:hypothetical protein
VAAQSEINNFLVDLVDENFVLKVQSVTRSSISDLLDKSGFSAIELAEKLREAPYELGKETITEEELTEAVEEVLAEYKPAEGDVGSPGVVGEKVEPPAEISEEIYAELGEALAEDLTKGIALAEPQVFAALLKDDAGLWAEVRAALLAELDAQDVTDITPETIAEAMRAPAWQAITDAFTGMWEAMRDAGGYEWLLTQSES